MIASNFYAKFSKININKSLVWDYPGCFKYNIFNMNNPSAETSGLSAKPSETNLIPIKRIKID